MKIEIAQTLWTHPSEVMLIDDDINLLNSLVKKIDPGFSSITFSNPEEALKHLKENALPLKKLSQAIISDIEPSEEKHLSTENVAIDFSPLHADLDKPIRFRKNLVVVVDRAMKEIDGLEFCKIVRQLGLPVKLILLTGHTETKEAVAAFNDHIIDAFIEKSTDVVAMMNQVNSHIKALTFQAFCDSSRQLLGPILNKLSLLSNKKFADFSNKVFKENNAVEYYLLDSSYSYLLLTAAGSAKIFLVKSAEDFRNALDIGSGDESLNSEVLEALKNRTAFPFTGMDSYFISDLSEWKDNMVSMTKIDNLDLYYAIADYTQEKVLSFDKYVGEIWRP